MMQLFIAWVPFQRRSISMKSYFGYELQFLSFAFKSRFLRPLEYAFKAWKTLTLFLHQHPQVIWVQLPPSPILHIAYFYKIFFDKTVRIIADCHNATFRSPWIKIPGIVTLLNRCDLILIHNDLVKAQAVAIGVNSEKLYVLEDPPALVENNTKLNQQLFTHPLILCPCSFNYDEPIQTVLDAARLTPEITYVLTGKVERAKGIHDLSCIPTNIKFPGFLSQSEFDNLLCNADAILGLTKLDGIQLSVANEAVGAAKPMILANTHILKKLFYKGAIYVDAIDSNSIAQGCKEALLRKNELTQAVSELIIERQKRWLAQAEKLI
ncbi:hypothetical protein DSM106972_035820 [Dulcicalothrix desertica PCC 7102]|uniref:Glycosyltransferase n=1 Tax=Dulcicalothrix desertica PCC 7102 TaxID=232991 RepID=A0A433VHM4_9CYAN|nr:hypothetical protein [Dulcicalothrix desertica]RUT05575.1 hypothetical protein DSM106972_035820 [Dulcicalothrix desertica PCC 7102]TWH54671.1 glycosyltransferase involved in cell wall biosynthesis [Dulcicalothrix desertica PCC 7102]